MNLFFKKVNNKIFSNGLPRLKRKSTKCKNISPVFGIPNNLAMVVKKHGQKYSLRSFPDTRRVVPEVRFTLSCNAEVFGAGF